MSILESVGLRVDLKRARDAFREAGARVGEEARQVGERALVGADASNALWSPSADWLVVVFSGIPPVRMGFRRSLVQVQSPPPLNSR